MCEHPRLLSLTGVDARYLLRRDGTFMDVNAAGCRLLDYTREQLLARTVLDVQEGLGATRWNDLWESVTRGDALTVETIARRRDGPSFPMEVRLAPVQYDAEVVILALAHDVTARHEADAELARRAEQQAAVAKLGRRAIVAVHAAALIDDAVAAVVRILAVDSAEVVASGSGADAGTGAGMTSATFEEGNGRVGVLAVHAPAGRTFTQDEREFLQAVAHVVGAAIAREREGHLQAQGERLRRLEAVAASIGHDLNNVLGVVLNYGQFAVEAAADQPELRADVMEIIEAAERAIALAASLMASGGAGPHGAGVEPIDSGPRPPQDGRPLETRNGAAGPGPAPLGLGEKILVVEDEEAARRVTSRILSESGYEILVAESFEAAATVWEAHRPTIDLLLTDVALGTRSGADLADMLWQTAPQLPVLFISGRTGDVALGHGGNRDRRTAVVVKPLESESLLRSVCAVLEGRS